MMKRKHARTGGRTLSGTYMGIKKSNLKYYVLNGVIYTTVTNLYKPFAQKFIFRLNGTEADVSLYNALPGLIAVFAIIPGIVLMTRCKSRKNVLSVFFFLARLFMLSFAVVPLLPEPIRPIAFVLLCSFMNFPEAVSQTALQSYSADVFAEDERAGAISARNKYSTFGSFIILLILGQLMNYFGSTDSKAIYVYQIFFIAAFILGIYEIICFYKIKEVNQCSNESIDVVASTKEVFKNKAFIRFMACSLLFHFGWQMGWPLFSIYQIKYLGANEVWLTISNVTSGIAQFASFSYWEKLINKKGDLYAIALATTGMAATPIMYALSPNLYILTVAGIIMGFFTAGTTTCVLSSLLEAAPEKNRIMYVGMHGTLTNVTLAVAPLLGAFVLARSNIYIALVICAAARFAGSYAFFKREKHARRARITGNDVSV